MRKKFLLVFTVFLILFLHSKTFAQCKPGDPYSCISEFLAKARMNVFKFKKKVLINKGWHANDFTFTDVGKIRTLLQQLKDAGKYDGIRLYFALSDEIPHGFDINTLYIVLVPTTYNLTPEPDGEKISNDDEANAYIISDNNFKPVNLNTDYYVMKWIHRYVNMAVPRIETKFEKEYGYRLQEAHSIWYSARTLFKMDADGLGPDLLTYLINHQVSIAQAQIHFASWALEPDIDEGPLSFEMSLVFKFTNNKNDTYLTFGQGDIINRIQRDSLIDNKKDLIKTLKQTYTDTGNPCPPNKCP